MSVRKLIGLVIATSLLCGCMASQGTRVDNLPMYGQPSIQRPAALKQADEDFIKKATQGVGSRAEASEVWWLQGERFMAEGNLDFAMRRYNQSWLLNPNNYQPYWGFARVLLEINDLDGAINHLEKAESLINDPYQQVALLTDLGVAYTYKGLDDRAFFAKANMKFRESTELDAGYANAWRRWAFSLYEQGQYADAMAKVKKTQTLKGRAFPQAFLDDLQQKLSAN